jgi:GNAT superfamily N-acetyltransferase
MNQDLHFAPLAEHPELLPELERLFLAEWADYYGEKGSGDARADLVEYSRPNGLPTGIVALLGSSLCGMAALKPQSIETHAEFTPWIGAGIVPREFRRQGIGSKLVQALEDLARDRGYRKIFSATNTANRLLERLGWKRLEIVDHDGKPLAIYEKVLRSNNEGG